MKKSLIKDVVVFLILLAAAAVLCYFLPDITQTITPQICNFVFS